MPKWQRHPLIIWLDMITLEILVALLLGGLALSGGTLSATGSGAGTVTSVSVVSANGVSGTIATATTTPAITLALGNITPSSVNVSGLAVSELVATDGSKNLQSLDIAIYPSLTEISYVKDVTSAIQTQIDGKQPTGSYLTAVTSNAPLSGSGTGGSHLVISQANTSTDGYLSSTDWNTFNGKGAGTVTSVSGTTNRITSTGGTTPVIDISASYVGQSSITTLGTVGTGTWQGTAVGPTYGGTGVNNGASTITLGGNINTAGAFSTSGAHAFTATLTADTNVTFPTSGTLSTTTGTVTAVSVATANGFSGSSSGGY